MSIKKAKITDLNFDDKNFNKGSQFGNALIEKSFQKFGAGRSILLDKNNNIIAGNKSTENYGAIGGEDVIIVESDGTKLIAVKRTDIDLNTPKGRELALADNATAKANIVWDEEMLIETLEENVIEEWGVRFEEDKEHQENIKELTNMIAVTLTDDESEIWLHTKEKIGKHKDKNAIFELIKLYANETNID